MAEQAKKEAAQEGRAGAEALAQLADDVKAIREAIEKVCQQSTAFTQVLMAVVEGIYHERWSGRLLFFKDKL